MRIDPGDVGHLPLRRLLIARLRLIVLICTAGGTVYAGLDLSAWQPAIWPSFACKLAGLGLAGVTLLLLAQPWAVRRAVLLGMVIIAVAYGITALSSALNPNGESRSTALLFTGAALSTAVLLPWGAGAQLATVVVGAVSLVAATWGADGDLHGLDAHRAAAVAIGFLLSLVAAREVGRYRVAHRRELLERQRAEGALRRLALRLEHRVAQRTVALQRTHEALRRHQAELAHVLRLHTVGEMTAALAHEINQPLGAITNYAHGGAQRLRDGRGDREDLLAAFEHIASEGLRAAKILRGVRRLARRDTEVSDSVDVNALAAEALRVLEPQARQHGVTVRLLGDALLPAVPADGTQIEQVILNLALNGVEAAAQAHGVRREVTVATTVQRDSIEVAVSDSGRGLAPAVRERLFTPFLTTKARGLGLGLAISRSIVESHGGRLWATPRSGTGMTFRFSLPLDGCAASRLDS
ncbi:MAG: ATP-binding protein [bacterium]